MQQLPAWFRLLRPNQWAKNLFVFAPALFSQQLQYTSVWIHSFVAFVTFCLASSSVYVVNDYLDVEADRAHPIKSHTRPLAAGEVTLSVARLLVIVMLSAVALTLVFYPMLLWPIAAYLLINLSYNLGLRGLPVIDLVLISLGFASRVWAGAVVISVPLTPWMVVDTFFLALYLATMKRRHEFKLSLELSRKSLRHYRPWLISLLVIVAVAGAVASYIVFTFLVRPQLTITAVFVVLGLWRFWVVSNQIENEESPTDALVRDWPMILISAMWVTACYLLLVLWH